MTALVYSQVGSGSSKILPREATFRSRAHVSWLLAASLLQSFSIVC